MREASPDSALRSIEGSTNICLCYDMVIAMDASGEQEQTVPLV